MAILVIMFVTTFRLTAILVIMFVTTFRLTAILVIMFVPTFRLTAIIVIMFVMTFTLTAILVIMFVTTFRLTAILVIMFVPTFNTAVILYLSVNPQTCNNIQVLEKIPRAQTHRGDQYVPGWWIRGTLNDRGSQVIIRKAGLWNIVVSVFEECHAPCMIN